MKNKIKIRKATAADYKDISRIFEQGDQHHENILPTYFCRTKNARSLDDIMTFIAPPAAEIFLAIKELELVGVLTIKKSQSPPFPFFKKQKFALIDSIIVDEKYRKQKIGQILLNEAITWSLEQSLKCIQLTVWEANVKAIDFYQKNGFSTLSRKMTIEL